MCMRTHYITLLIYHRVTECGRIDCLGFSGTQAHPDREPHIGEFESLTDLEKKKTQHIRLLSRLIRMNMQLCLKIMLLSTDTLITNAKG